MAPVAFRNRFRRDEDTADADGPGVAATDPDDISDDEAGEWLAYELHEWAFRHSRHYSVGQLEIQVAPPEYVIVRKLEFYREGGSQKHLRDIRSMLSLSPDLINMATLEAWVKKRGLHEPWAEVLGT